MNPSTLQIIGAGLFCVAVLHTFLTKYFEHLAHVFPNHAGVFHLLGEVEVVFGFWAMVMMAAFVASTGTSEAVTYIESRNFTEPMFVFVIMVIAATKPVTVFVEKVVVALATKAPANFGVALYFIILSSVPLLGSFVTEPAAMTIAAFMLRDIIFAKHCSTRLRYATLGVLFVNVSIGGTLTTFAAPPVLMVAAKWNWDMMYMLTHFGWKSALACGVNAAIVALMFRRELTSVQAPEASKTEIPLSISLIHIVFLAFVVATAHHPAIFMGVFLFFIGFTTAYKKYQNPLILREALMVGFFLAGLVVLGGLQQWWLEPTLLKLNATSVYYGATALTAITDNAALTYLGSLVEGLSDEFKISLVAGAVTGGGLTLIANAPNPAGAAILKGKFSEQTINPLALLAAATPPTLVAILAFRLL
jgi:Putative Na+/H+ antiporter